MSDDFVRHRHHQIVYKKTIYTLFSKWWWLKMIEPPKWMPGRHIKNSQNSPLVVDWHCLAYLAKNNREKYGFSRFQTQVIPFSNYPLPIFRFLATVSICLCGKKITFPNWGEVAAHENFQDIREHSPPGTPKNQTILDDDEVMLKWEMTEMKLMVMSHDMTSIYTFLLVLDPVGCSLMSHDMTSIYTFLLVLDPVGCSLFSMTCLSRNQANLCWFLDIFLLDFFLRFGRTFHALFVDEVFHQELNEGAEPWPHELFSLNPVDRPVWKKWGSENRRRLDREWTMGPGTRELYSFED